MTKEQKYVSDEEVIQYIKEQEVVTVFVNKLIIKFLK